MEIWEPEHVGGLFDSFGFRIPPVDLQANKIRPTRRHRFEQPAMDNVPQYSEIARQIAMMLNVDEFISGNDFFHRTKVIVEGIHESNEISGALNGNYLPFCLPRVDLRNYGATLMGPFLTGFVGAYKGPFGTRQFTSRIIDQFSHQVEVVRDSRHERFVQALRENVVVGLYFHTALLGWSVDAAVEQMSSLPEQFMLAGGLDTMAAMMAYPNEFVARTQAPWLFMPAIRWQVQTKTLYFSCDHETGLLQLTSDNYPGMGVQMMTHGLVVIG